MPLYYLDTENQPRLMEDAQIGDFAEQGVIHDATYVWKEGLTDWIPFAEIKDDYLRNAGDQVEKTEIGFQEGSFVWEILNHETFLVKKALDAKGQMADFDIFEPEMGALILECREEAAPKDSKTSSSNLNVVLRLPHGGHQVARLNGRFKRVFGFSAGKAHLYDDEDKLIGVVKKGKTWQDLVTIYSPDEEVRIVTVRGSLKDWDFQIVGAGFSPMTTSRNWDGEGRELITEDGNFAIVFPSTMPQNDPVREMTLITMLALERLLG